MRLMIHPTARRLAVRGVQFTVQPARGGVPAVLIANGTNFS